MKFNGDTLVSVEGELTLLGVTKPVNLMINKFKCIQDAMTKKEIVVLTLVRNLSAAILHELRHQLGLFSRREIGNSS